MSEPTTEAGRRLLRWLEAWDLGERPASDRPARSDVLAIEAEAALQAADDALADVAAKVRALWQDDVDAFDDRSVLALLQPVAPPEPDPA